MLVRMTSVTRFVLSGSDVAGFVIFALVLMMDARLHTSSRQTARRTAPAARRARGMRDGADSIVSAPALSTILPGGHRCGDRMPAGAFTRRPDRHSIQRRVRVGPIPQQR